MTKIQINATALQQRRGRPRDVESMPPKDAAPPRRYNIFTAPTLGPSRTAAPARAGALDFLALKSRGVGC